MWYMYGRRVANHGLPYLAMTIGPLAQQWANHESCHRSHATLCSSSPSRNKGIHHLFHHPRIRTSAPGRQTWWKWMSVAIVCDHQLPQVDCSVLEERADGCPLRWRDARNHLRCASTPILFLTASCQRQCFSRDIKDCQKSKKQTKNLLLSSDFLCPEFLISFSVPLNMLLSVNFDEITEFPNVVAISPSQPGVQASHASPECRWSIEWRLSSDTW